MIFVTISKWSKHLRLHVRKSGCNDRQSAKALHRAAGLVIIDNRMLAEAFFRMIARSLKRVTHCTLLPDRLVRQRWWRRQSPPRARTASPRSAPLVVGAAVSCWRSSGGLLVSEPQRGVSSASRSRSSAMSSTRSSRCGCALIEQPGTDWCVMARELHRDNRPIDRTTEFLDKPRRPSRESVRRSHLIWLGRRPPPRQTKAATRPTSFALTEHRTDPGRRAPCRRYRWRRTAQLRSRACSSSGASQRQPVYSQPFGPTPRGNPAVPVRTGAVARRQRLRRRAGRRVFDRGPDALRNVPEARCPRAMR